MGIIISQSGLTDLRDLRIPLRDGWLLVRSRFPHGPGVRYLHNSNFAPTVGGRFTF